MELSIPLLENMNRVDYREDVNIRHSLFICHRESVLNEIVIRKGVDSDVQQIEKLIENIPEFVTIMHQVKMSFLSMDNGTEINEKTGNINMS